MRKYLLVPIALFLSLSGNADNYILVDKDDSLSGLLWSLGFKSLYGSSGTIEQVADLNNIKDKDRIRHGIVIVVPDEIIFKSNVIALGDKIAVKKVIYTEEEYRAMLLQEENSKKIEVKPIKNNEQRRPSLWSFGVSPGFLIRKSQEKVNNSNASLPSTYSIDFSGS